MPECNVKCLHMLYFGGLWSYWFIYCNILHHLFRRVNLTISYGTDSKTVSRMYPTEPMPTTNLPELCFPTAISWDIDSQISQALQDQPTQCLPNKKYCKSPPIFTMVWYPGLIPPLPVSQVQTTILLVIDCFSKSLLLVHFLGLATAFQTAECLLQHFFRWFDITKDIVSGPQFTSSMEEMHGNKSGVYVSLKDGYHPHNKRANQEISQFLWIFCNDHPEK